MLKVLKFGGSSLADAAQFAKVKHIVESDPSRRVVVVSAPGKRFSEDHKITDLLYLCAAHIEYAKLLVLWGGLILLLFASLSADHH